MPSIAAKTSDYPVVKLVKQSSYSRAKVSEPRFSSAVNEVLPFRIKIYNIGLQEYGVNNPAPVGIAIIGYNNYVL